MAQLRSRHDREIIRLAVPALGALAAEPLYLLADTAIVGHLGTAELAALALAATLLSALVTLCNFLTYGTTARVARLHGAGEDEAAGRIAAQSLWLALALGALLALVVVVFAGPLVALLGGQGRVADHRGVGEQVERLGRQRPERRQREAEDLPVVGGAQSQSSTK